MNLSSSEQRNMVNATPSKLDIFKMIAHAPSPGILMLMPGLLASKGNPLSPASPDWRRNEAGWAA